MKEKTLVESIFIDLLEAPPRAYCRILFHPVRAHNKCSCHIISIFHGDFHFLTDIQIRVTSMYKLYTSHLFTGGGFVLLCFLSYVRGPLASLCSVVGVCAVGFCPLLRSRSAVWEG